MFDLQLEGRSVIVTGATGGIGAAIARALASHGAQVLAVDLDRDETNDLVSSLDGTGHRAVRADLRDLSCHDELVTAAENIGDFWGLIHTAAVLRRRSTIAEVTVEDWDLQHDVNLRATFFLNRCVADALTTNGGRVVNFGSQGWWTGGLGGSVVYAATKGGIVSLTRGMARTYAPHGVLFNCISPGFVDTAMLRQGISESQLAELVAQVPLGRMTTVEEIADASLFLVSGREASTTGAVMNISGGFLMY